MPPGDEKSGGASWSEVADRVREVAAACTAASLERLRVVSGDVEIEVRRRPLSRAVVAAAPSSPDDPLPEAPSRNGEVAQAIEPVLLRSDVVGVIRMSRPAVAEGALLESERELAYVESLGVRNPVLSGGTGRIVAVLVEDGQPVEYGQPLFAIER
jgi:acetyl-CoA carboxylase biotin carboxyl carrier protein